MRWAVLGAAGVVCSCGLLTNLGDLGGDGGADVAREDGGPRCDRDSSFRTPEEVTELADSTGLGEFAARLTADELDIFYSHIDTNNAIRTYSAHRATRDATFGAPSEVVALRGSGSIDAFPTVTADGATYFAHSDSDGSAGFGVFTAFRSGVQFGPLQLVTTLETPAFEGDPYVSPDGQELFFVRGSSSVSSDQMIYASIYGAGQFVSVTTPLMGGVNVSGFRSRAPVITTDRLTLYFASNRGDGADDDIWRAVRASLTSPFGSAEIVGELVTPGDDVPSWISPDECVMYLARKTTSAQHVFRAARSP